MNEYKKYLELYAEDIVKDCEMVSAEYRHVLVIPAFKEGESFVKNLRTFSNHIRDRALCVIVINEPNGASDDAREENRALKRSLLSLGKSKSESDLSTLIRLSVLDLLVVGPLILEKNLGVGLARKIGCDLALSLIARQQVQCPVIFNTDADAQLPSDYFEQGENALVLYENAAAFTFRFIHTPPEDEKERRAILLYEQRLQRYVDGLLRIKSPYAFHTIGSSIAVHSRAYAKVRGFPKCAAGEDFYLLNKLRKVGDVVSLYGNPICLSARVSTRVPFGTGPSLRAILDYDDVDDAPIFYHEEIFAQLAIFLTHKFDTPLPPLIDDAVQSLSGIDTIKKHLLSQKCERVKNKAFHDWFDGFRTLKVIHYLRDKTFPMQSMKDVRESALPRSQISYNRNI